MSKNCKGGYKIIPLLLDLAVVASAGEAVEVKGIHERIEASYGKPLLLSAIKVDSVEKNDVYINELKVVDGSFVFKAYGYEITVTADDEVYVNSGLRALAEHEIETLEAKPFVEDSDYGYVGFQPDDNSKNYIGKKLIAISKSSKDVIAIITLISFSLANGIVYGLVQDIIEDVWVLPQNYDYFLQD